MLSLSSHHLHQLWIVQGVLRTDIIPLHGKCIMVPIADLVLDDAFETAKALRQNPGLWSFASNPKPRACSICMSFRKKAAWLQWAEQLRNKRSHKAVLQDFLHMQVQQVLNISSLAAESRSESEGCQDQESCLNASLRHRKP